MKITVMSLHQNSSTLKTTKMDHNSDKVTPNGYEVKIVTIAGKQVEVKYETLKKKYDIFGLHSKPRRYSDRKSRTNDIINNTSNSNAIKKNVLNSKPVESFRTSISSTTSCNSKETSVGSTKLSKIFKRFESDDRSPKKNESIEKIADKLKKEKEPVKMENRFDMLLPSSNGEDLKLFSDYNSIVKSSAKKRKKKKTEINDNLINNRNNSFDNNSNNSTDFDAHQQLIAQKVILVHETIESIYDNESNDQVFQSNNNNNDYNNQNRKNADEKQKDYMKVKHGFNDSSAQFNNPFEDEEHAEHEVEKKVEEKVVFKEREVKRDEELVAVRKETKKQSYKAKYPNGLIIRPIGLSDNSVKNDDRNKSKNRDSHQNEELRQKIINDSSLNANLVKLTTNWLFITLLVVVFLVIYSLVILNQFCHCSKAS